jgi:hypothetical protein
MSIDVVDEALSVLEPEPDDEDIELTGTIIWYYYVIVGVQSERGGAKNVMCTFSDCALTGCTSTRAIALILGRPVTSSQTEESKY